MEKNNIDYMVNGVLIEPKTKDQEKNKAVNDAYRDLLKKVKKEG